MTDNAFPGALKSEMEGGQAGHLLRQAREANGLTLDQLAGQIKVSTQKLAALEQGRYGELGDSNFIRALAMTVCRALRVEATPILAGLPAARLHSLSQDKTAINAPFRDHDGVPALFDRGHRLNLRALMAPKWLAPLSLLSLAGLIYVLPESIEWPSWIPEPDAIFEPSGAQLHADAVTAPSSIQVAADAAIPAAEEVASAASAAVLPGEVMASAPEFVVEGSVATPTALPAPAVASAAPGFATVQIALTDDSWIELVDASGVKVFSRIARAGEALELQGQAPLKLRIGNASAVQVRFNGQPVTLTGITRNNTARVELK
jgi:cytoskeleton protein RodZ